MPSSSPSVQAKRRKAEQLRAEIHAVASRSGIEVEESGTRSAKAQLFTEGRRRVVVVPPIRGMSSYLVALHELGHHLAPKAMTGTRLVRESAAWSWAMSNARFDPTPGARKSALKALYGYGFWVADRQYRKRPPLMPGPDFQEAATQIVGGSQELYSLAVELGTELTTRAAAARRRRPA
ncbi:MAG: hypothetical protein ACR2N5_08480 [Solirubrobacterales bacterium]